MEYCAKSDIGNYREQNEDYFFAVEEPCLFIVADGMGGHKAGEIASKTAVDSFVTFFLNKFKSSDAGRADTEMIKVVMTAAIEFANLKVFNLSRSTGQYSGMGTTFTACHINSGKAFVIHVGDSRLYLYHQGGLKLLTEDQTIVGEMFKKGIISYEEMFNHPLRNYLNNVVGTDRVIDALFMVYDLAPGDILLLCSDGLNAMLRDKEIFKIVKKSKSTSSITGELIKKAKSSGGLDNITVISIKI